MQVIQATKSQCDPFILTKHYARRKCIFWKGYALIEDGAIQGVAVFGQPSAPIQKYAFVDRDFRLYELARVVVQTRTANAASFLIGNALKMLEPKPCAVVSYADMEQSHCGIIYQATNWIYTGSTLSHDKSYIVNGERLHPTTIRDRFGVTDPTRWAQENGYQMLAPQQKHRYFYLIGSKSQKRNMLKSLKYPIINQYPKCPKSMYDDGDPITLRIKLQDSLF
jgi:hypothetical protein